MKIRPTAYVLSFIETLNTDKLTKTDYHIIQKNLSIYLDTKEAIKTLRNCLKYFKYKKFNSLMIATAITLATKYAQNGFNEKITQNNISNFIDEIFKEDSLELLFYVKDTEDRTELINVLTSRLSYLKKYNNIERIMIYIYNINEELLVNNLEKVLTEEYKQYNTSDDYYDSYKFGYYYVPNDFEYYYPKNENSNFKNEKFNTFVTSIYYNLHRGYGPGQGNRTYEILNDWYVYTY